MTDAYLTSLQRAVRDLPRPLADDIVSGVREELRGLDAAAAAQRIAELGDPEFIAASARDEVPARQDAGWYTVLTIVLLAVGGFVVPVIGWLVGLVMLWYSRTWVLRDKLIVTLLIPGLASLVVGAFALIELSRQTDQAPAGEVVNPLIPFPFAHSGILVIVILAPIVTAIYLAVRVRRLK